MNRACYYLLLMFVILGCREEGGAEIVSSNRDAGIVALDNAIAQNPGEADLFVERAELWYGKENYDAAIEDYQQALAIDSLNVEYHWHLAEVYFDYYKSRLAIRTLERAVAIDPDNVETGLRLADMQLYLKQYPAAIRSLNEVTRVDPRNPDAYTMLSEAFLAQGDTARAIKAAEEATEIDPDLPDSFVTLGQLLFAKGLPRAGQYFDAAISIDPSDPYPLHAKADFLRDSELLSEAIELYRRASRVDRQYVAGHFNAGLLLMELDSVRVAEAEFDLAIKNDPSHVRAYFFRGYARELLEDFPGARADYATALNFDPDYDLAQAGLDRIAENIQ